MILKSLILSFTLGNTLFFKADLFQKEVKL